MKKYYFTFGQNHTHRVNGIAWDCDSVCCIEAEDSKQARQKMFDNFGLVWAFQYDDIEKVKIEYFPRGIINLERSIK